MLEWPVLVRLVSHVLTSLSSDMMQSGHRKWHWTETALLKITNDIFEGFNSRKSMILVALDQSDDLVSVTVSDNNDQTFSLVARRRITTYELIIIYMIRYLNMWPKPWRSAWMGPDSTVVMHYWLAMKARYKFDKMIMLRLKAVPFIMVIIQLYMPIARHTDEEIEDIKV